jgi:transketolase
MNVTERAELEGFAKEIRKLAIRMIGELGVGHIGGAMSIADILAVLYGKHLKADPKNPRAADRDRLVLSKGHAGSRPVCSSCRPRASFPRTGCPP